ncbi:sulfotransferase [Alloalcanivorax xenomutans]|uniref:sulfotransferase n=1 Tax=Alloalcanivorax xenomutans TaxID=1094342 RepID=UPI0024E22391|nr:sulfotransferase [Alloalcanivorax xenomutans]
MKTILSNENEPKKMDSLIVHIGYSKCMSTWLQGIFYKHPDIRYACRTNFFQKYDSNFGRGIDWYLEQFSGDGVCLESDEHLLLPEIDEDLWLNKSNMTAVSEVLGRIRQSVEKPKIIFVYRSQVDMILSRYIQFVRSGGSLSFDHFFDRTFESGRWQDYYDYRYSRLHDLLESMFGKEHFLSINIDYFKSNKEETLEKLSVFLGVPISEDLLPKKGVNVSPSYYAIKIQFLLNKIMVKRKKTHTQRASTRYGYYTWKLPMKLVEKIDSFLVKDKKRYQIVSDEKIRKIKKTYEADNLKLIERTGDNLFEYHLWMDR